MNIYLPQITLKTCSCCGVSKEISLFNKDRNSKDGLQYKCRDCEKAHYQANKEKKKAQRKARYQANPEKENAQARAYYQADPEKFKAQRKARYHANPDKENARNKAYQQNRWKNDPEYKILCNLRNRVYQAIKGNSKSASTMDLLGCSIEFLKSHIESQFEDWMTWDNYGYDTWHIDHIKPCASFDMSDPEQQKECFHYTNLQPLSASENMSKGAKVQ